MNIHFRLWIIIQYYLIYFGVQIVPALMFLEKWLILALGQETYTISFEPLVVQTNAYEQQNATVMGYVKGHSTGDSERAPTLLAFLNCWK